MCNMAFINNYIYIRLYSLFVFYYYYCVVILFVLNNELYLSIYLSINTEMRTLDFYILYNIISMISYICKIHY